MRAIQEQQIKRSLQTEFMVNVTSLVEENTPIVQQLSYYLQSELPRGMAEC